MSEQEMIAPMIALAEAGIPADIQELLLRGNPARGIAPGALAKAIAASRTPEGMVMVPRNLLEAAVDTYEGEWGEATSPTAWPNRMKAMLFPTPSGAE